MGELGFDDSVFANNQSHWGGEARLFGAVFIGIPNPVSIDCLGVFIGQQGEGYFQLFSDLLQYLGRVKGYGPKSGSSCGDCLGASLQLDQLLLAGWSPVTRTVKD